MKKCKIKRFIIIIVPILIGFIYLNSFFGVIGYNCNTANLSKLIKNLEKRNISLVICSINNLSNVYFNLSEEERNIVIRNTLALLEVNKKTYLIDYFKNGFSDYLEYDERKNEILTAVMAFYSSDTSFFYYLDSVYINYFRHDEEYYQILTQDIIFLLAFKHKQAITRDTYFNYLDNRIPKSSPLINYKLSLKFDYDFGTIYRRSWESFQLPDSLIISYY